MTKEIKFRCWNKEHPMKETEWLDQHNHVEGCHLMQFTGLLDKNGTPIFEGDIVKNVVKEIYSVVWDAPCYWLSKNGELEDTFYNGNGSTYEIIGNVYQDSHLLESRTN